MADTVRTEGQLLVLFADNTSGDISAQDSRDFIVSIYDEDRKGEVKISSNDTTKDTLDTKLVAGTNISLVENNDGGNETLTISASGGGGGGGTVQATDGTYDIQATDDGAPDGNARGEYSVDLQTHRAAATQIASGIGAAILGGRNNTAAGNRAAVIAGFGNSAAGNYALASGQNTTASGVGSTTSGYAVSSGTIIANAAGASATGYSTTSGDILASGKGAAAFGYVTSGTGDIIAAGLGSIAGGYCKAGDVTHALGKGSFAFGNDAYTAAPYSAIIGGERHDIDATANRAFIAGGYFGRIQSGSANSAIVGGRDNYLYQNSPYSVMLGGYSNYLNADRAIMAGGTNNNVSGDRSVCLAGQYNYISGANSVVAGSTVTASGYVSFGFGKDSTASASYSFACGNSAIASRFGQFARSSGNFSDDGDAQTSQWILRNQTTDATQTELFLNGSSERLVLPDNTTWAFQVRIVARRTDDSGEGAFYVFDGAIDRFSGASSIGLIGTPIKVEEEDDTDWDADVDADTTNGSLRIRVTGEASKDINWVAYVRTVETTAEVIE